jgi:predicted MFS family arabinose efflux permease
MEGDVTLLSVGRREEGFTYRGIFRAGEFRALVAAQSVSVVGDQFARVALAVLVFDRTGSPAWTAITYGLTFLPDLVGGPMLSGLADRYPRRRVMVAADLARAVLVALMAVPDMPLAVVVVLLVAAQLLGSPANAARGALLPQVLGDEAYPAGQAVLQTVTQVAQVVGFAGGGALVAWIGTGGVLLADALTFALSALLLRQWIRPRPAAVDDGAVVDRGWWRDLADGAVLVWSDPRLRALIAFACVSGFYIAGEALAAPYAAALGGGPVGVGLLFAAYAAGASAGMLVVARLPEARRLRGMPPLVVASCAPLVVCLADPPLPLVVLLFLASGIGSAYHVVASTTFVLGVPDDRRGQAFGLAVTALKVSQGLGVALAGLAAEAVAVHLVVAAAGALGVLAGLGAIWMWRAATATRPAGGPPEARRA